MPEFPDFEQIAAPLAEYADDTRRKQIAEQLRLVWNARGAADLWELEFELDRMVGVQASAEQLKVLAPTLRSLDR